MGVLHLLSKQVINARSMMMNTKGKTESYCLFQVISANTDEEIKYSTMLHYSCMMSSFHYILGDTKYSNRKIYEINV